jgi:hypothetical protein
MRRVACCPLFADPDVGTLLEQCDYRLRVIQRSAVPRTPRVEQFLRETTLVAAVRVLQSTGNTVQLSV